VVAIEMELAGVYRASRRAHKTYPVVSIRGVSDIVGLKRDEAWTQYACEVAAAYASAFIRSWHDRP
jgi:nucleoside phosphorylase